MTTRGIKQGSSFYGRVKLHKDAAPLRPVVAMCGTAAYQQAHYFATILHPLVGSSGRVLRTTKPLLGSSYFSSCHLRISSTALYRLSSLSQGHVFATDQAISCKVCDSHKASTFCSCSLVSTDPDFSAHLPNMIRF